jgi:hypothetical protein
VREHVPATRKHPEPSARRFAVARLVRTLVPPLVLALPPLFWVLDATRRESLTTLGRDQGIFQYVAWALTRGAVDYRDVRDVNGPLTHLVHRVLLALGGADEHRFHILDLAVTGATFALAGACVPGLRSRRPPDALERVAWALAGWVVLSGQYLLYGYWDVAQRESFFDWFLLPSIALQLVAQGTPDRRGSARWPRRQACLLALVGALAAIPVFGKPTYGLFALAQLAVLLSGEGLAVSRKKAVIAFAVGGALGAATQLAFLVAYGDVRAFARIQFVDVPGMYRFIWPRATADLLSDPWRATQAVFAVTGALVLLGLVALREMPWRVSIVALAPLCALASVVAQAKGFPYHFHPVTATVHLQWLVFASWLAERARVSQRRWAIVRLAPLAVSAIFALRIATALEDSPYVRAVWLLWGAKSPADRTTREYFAHFPEPDFFPFELREAAGYLSQHTGPDDRVQVYGMDPYLLFLARRLSASPYIYAYDLNADAALAGGTGGRPDEAQAKRIRALRDAHESDLLARIEGTPPAAFVFLDASPLMSELDAWGDFEEHCSRAAAWVQARYRETARFGHDHVWLRLDLAGSEVERRDERDERGDRGARHPREIAPIDEAPLPAAP